jgi:phage protein D
MPTGFTPVYKIMHDGSDITNRFNDRTLSIQVQLNGGEGASDTCEITIDDRDWKVAAVEIGAKLEIYLGYKEIGYAQQGIFNVTTVDYEINPRQIKIIGTSVDLGSAIKAPKIRSFENKTLDDILGTFAKDSGLTTAIDPELGKIELPFLNQTKSPMHMLHELERRFGAVGKIENNKLIFTKRDEGESASGERTPLLVLQPQNVSKGFVRHTERSDFSSAKVGYFDENHVKKFAEEKNPSATTDEEGQQQDNPFLSGGLARSEKEAKQMAKAQIQALNRSKGEVHMTLSKGDPWIRDQTQVLVKGFRDKINGSYVANLVTHSYVKDSGIITEIVAKPPGDGGDFNSLDEGAFYALGSTGIFTSPEGPIPPTELIGPSQPDPDAEKPTPEPPAPPINV